MAKSKKPGEKDGRARGADGRFAEGEESRVRKWQERIRAANALYEKWEKRFDVKRGEDYYEGFQAPPGMTEDEARSRYMVNLTLASVETQKPSLLFFKPQYRVEPRPARFDDDGAREADQQAKICQDTLQTFIDDENVGFTLETQLGVHEAHFRFAVVEVGYTADFIDNPNADKPALQEKDPTTDPDGPPAATPPAKVVEREAVYVKRIPAENFRVSLSSRNRLSSNDWVGYFEWHYVEDVKRNPQYANTDDLRSTGFIDSAYRTDTTADEVERRHGMVKLWKIWDTREGVKHVLADGHKQFLLEGKRYKFLPFSDLKFLELPGKYYPLPVVFNWLPAQDEYNDQREMKRVHRKRFTRRYTALTGSIDEGELQKLESGADGVVVWAKAHDALRPVDDARLAGVDIGDTMQTLNDFTTVSGVTGEQRGHASSDTATEANIVDQRARLRESSARMKVATWLGSIGRLMLLAAREHMALPIAIQMHADPMRAGQQETATKAARWKEIQAKELGTLDLDVTVDLASLSPMTQDAQRQSWNQVLALLSNPVLLMLLSQSEALFRKTLSLYGIQSEHEVQEIMKVAQTIALMQAQGTGMQGGGAAGAGGAAMPPAMPGQPAGIPASGPVGVQ